MILRNDIVYGDDVVGGGDDDDILNNDDDCWYLYFDKYGNFWTSKI